MKYLLLALLWVASMQASQFTVSYTFTDDSRVDASFSGTLNGNLITNISDVSAYISGTWWQDGTVILTDIHSLTQDEWATQGGAVLSLDGTYLNFCFATNVPVKEGRDWWDRNVVWFGYSPLGIMSLYHYEAGGNYDYDPGQWNIVQSDAEPLGRASPSASASTVPEGGVTWCMMGAIALLAGVRRMTS